MISSEAKDKIRSACPDVRQDVIEEFFARMDEDYFSTFVPEEIAMHIAMSSRLDARHRVQFKAIPRAIGEFDIHIAGFDYLSEFSVFCGLLSAFGLDIQAGDIYSFSKQTGGVKRPSPRKIVDVFRVRLKEGERFDDVKQHEFEHELQTFAELLATGAVAEARERLNRFLTERIEKMHEGLTGLLAPMAVDFNNVLSPDWTVLEAKSEDVFGFLYAISNALAMREIYIHKVKIRSLGPFASDEFFIADRWGRKIEDAREQDMLRTVVAMIKQFTHFLPEAPDPAKAMRHFDQLLDKIAAENFPQEVMSFLAEPDGMEVLARLLGTSDFLWDEFLRIHFQDLIPLLKDVDKKPLRGFHEALARARTLEEKKAALNQFKDSQAFLIDVQHLLKPEVTLTQFSRALTDLAEIVIDEAARICLAQAGEDHGPVTICGLGKFGGREMGYASDLELLFIHQGEGHTPFFERLVRQIIDFVQSRKHGLFDIDLRLRPYGEKGSLSTPLDEFKKYYNVNGPAAPFERQALIKLRWAGGDEALGRAVESHLDAFVYSGAPWNSQDALHLRKRQMRELVKPGGVNVKYSPGGIIDVEYATQYLQLLHGKDHLSVRAPNTLEGLHALHELKFLTATEYRDLHDGYLFLRNLIDALRIVRGDASDLVLPQEDSEEFKALARRLGYRSDDRKKSAALLAADIRDWMTKVHRHFLSRFN